jgi:hypothetical protein
MPISPDKHEQVKKENIQLKENNELLLEENSVHRDLLMVITFPLFYVSVCSMAPNIIM